MNGERLQLRMHLRVVPVGPGHGGFQIVDHQPLRYAAEMMEGVLHRRDEVVTRLSPNDFAVALARVAQHDAKQPRSADLSAGIDHRRRRTEVDLSFFPGRRFHSANRQFPPCLNLRHESPHAVVAAAKSVVRLQILKDPPRRESLPELRLNDLLKRLAATGRTRLMRRRPGGRVWRVLKLLDKLAYRTPIHAQQFGDLTVRVSGLMQCLNYVDFSHRKSIRHDEYLRYPSCQQRINSSKMADFNAPLRGRF